MENKICTVRFIKKDGTIRKMNCRMGVTKHETGKGKKFDDKEYGIVSVYEMKSKQYRSFRVSSLLSLTVDNKTELFD